MSSSSNSPCAACKFLRRKCTQGCIFAPYFPPDNPGRFAQVHRVFGASNVAKLINDLTPAQREDAVNSLAYEAEARLHDPVYGCVGYISLLQQRLIQLQRDLSAAKKELSNYIGNPVSFNQFYPAAELGGGTARGALMYRDLQQQQQIVEAHEMMRRVEEQREMARLMGEGSLVSTQVGGFALLEQQQGGGGGGGGGSICVQHSHNQRRRIDEGRSGGGPSA